MIRRFVGGVFIELSSQGGSVQVSFETVQILVRLLASLRSWGEERPVHFTLAGPLVVLSEARKQPVNGIVYLIILIGVLT